MKNLLLNKLNSIRPDYNLELEVLRIIKHNTDFITDNEQLKENINYVLRYGIYNGNLKEFNKTDASHDFILDYLDDIKNFIYTTDLNISDFINANSDSYFDLIEWERELAELVFVAVLKKIIDKNNLNEYLEFDFEKDFLFPVELF